MMATTRQGSGTGSWSSRTPRRGRASSTQSVGGGLPAVGQSDGVVSITERHVASSQPSEPEAQDSGRSGELTSSQLEVMGVLARECRTRTSPSSLHKSEDGHARHGRHLPEAAVAGATPKSRPGPESRVWAATRRPAGRRPSLSIFRSRVEAEHGGRSVPELARSQGIPIGHLPDAQTKGPQETTGGTCGENSEWTCGDLGGPQMRAPRDAEQGGSAVA